MSPATTTLEPVPAPTVRCAMCERPAIDGAFLCAVHCPEPEPVQLELLPEPVGAYPALVADVRRAVDGFAAFADQYLPERVSATQLQTTGVN